MSNLSSTLFSRFIYMDDRQVERIVVQKFEPGSVFTFGRPTAKFAEALGGRRPLLDVRLSNDPFEESLVMSATSELEICSIDWCRS